MARRAAASRSAVELGSARCRRAITRTPSSIRGPSQPRVSTVTSCPRRTRAAPMVIVYVPIPPPLVFEGCSREINAMRIHGSVSRRRKLPR